MNNKCDSAIILKHLLDSGLLVSGVNRSYNIYGSLVVSLKPRESDDFGKKPVAHVCLDSLIPRITDSDVELVRSHIVARMDAEQAEGMRSIHVRQALTLYAIRQADKYLTGWAA